MQSIDLNRYPTKPQLRQGWRCDHVGGRHFAVIYLHLTTHRTPETCTCYNTNNISTRLERGNTDAGKDYNCTRGAQRAASQTPSLGAQAPGRATVSSPAPCVGRHGRDTQSSLPTVSGPPGGWPHTPPGHQHTHFWSTRRGLTSA